jgi:hypothetical protein
VLPIVSRMLFAFIARYSLALCEIFKPNCESLY